MREWLEKHGGHWTFGLFVLALLGTMGGAGVWGLNAQDARHDAKVESVSSQVKRMSAIAGSGIRRVEGKVESEVKRLDNRVDTTLELIEQIGARLDRMDDRFDRMDDRFDRMEVKLDRMDARLDRVEIRLDRMDGKLDTLLTRVSESLPK